MKTKFDKDFEAWYMSVFYLDKNNIGLNMPSIKLFNRSVPSMQFGVYQDFGDSVGYTISTPLYARDISGVKSFHANVVHKGNVRFEPMDQTRQEARQAAIDKFKEWYNENH